MRPEDKSTLLRRGSGSTTCAITLLGICVGLLWPLPTGILGLAWAARPTAPISIQHAGTASSPHVGSAMAVLATLEQAQVLPPEGTKAADRVVRSVIQFQSVFAKSSDPYLQDFVRRAVTKKEGEHAADVVAQFRSTGWTAEVLHALADAELQTPVDELRPLTAGFGQFNLSVEDFQRFMQLVRDGAQALAVRGQNFYEVYASHRRAMQEATGR